MQLVRTLSLATILLKTLPYEKHAHEPQRSSQITINCTFKK
jgi:hypothetical protein